MVHVRQIEGRRLTFIVSGKLWRNSLVMQDKETGTLWSHVTGEALHGPLAGHRLRMLPVVQTTWRRWYAEHPDTKLLAKPHEIRSSRYADYFRDKRRAGLFRTEWLRRKMPAKTLVHGIRIGPHALAVRDDRLKRGRFVQAELGGEPVVIVRAADGGVRAFAARADGHRLTFRRGKKGVVTDRETGSRWDLARGMAAAGPLKGTRLEELPVQPAFWFAWSAFFPNTAVVDPS